MPAPNEIVRRVSSDFGSATVMDSSTSGPAFGRSGRSMLNPHAIEASASTRIAEMIFAFMGNLLLCLIRGRFEWVARRECHCEERSLRRSKLLLKWRHHCRERYPQKGNCFLS